MGCASSSDSTYCMKIVPEVQQNIFATTANADQLQAERPIKEFPYFSTRLAPVDYKAIIASKKPWKDPNFKADVNSILDPTMMRPDRLKNWETFVWKRPSEVYGAGNFSIFKGITPTDIRQGACGDCYFLSSISSLAEFPERVEKIFLNKEVNEAGCYALQFYINGEPETVVLDDYFPWCNHKDNWAFSRSTNDKEIWVLLLEKAWAKIFGSYQRIEGGTTGEAFPAITGAPTKMILHAEVTDTDALWKQILDGDQKSFVMATSVASDRSGQTNQAVTNLGLVDAHAYSLIAAKELTHNLKKLRLVKIRNPWGQKEWNGDWSDKSDKWTPQLKEAVGFEAKEDGIFFISFEDYIKFFYITSICKYVEGGDLSVVEDEHATGKYCLSTFKITKQYDTPIVITLYQIHSRLVDETMRGSYQYAPLKLMLGKIIKEKQIDTKSATPEQDVIAFVDGEYMQYNHTHIELPSISPGDYVVFTKGEWDVLNPHKKLILNIYAPDPLEIKRVHTNQQMFSVYSRMDEWLGARLAQENKYQVPSYATK